jgi:hypothetical protein
MAAIFFTYADDSALLLEDIRDEAERDNVVLQSENDIIRWFTRGLGSSRVVALYGWDSDAPVNSEATLKQALKETIAEVASHRLRYYDEDPTIGRSVRGSRTDDRKVGSLDPLWPSGWERRLLDFETTSRRY